MQNRVNATYIETGMITSIFRIYNIAFWVNTELMILSAYNKMWSNGDIKPDFLYRNGHYFVVVVKMSYCAGHFVFHTCLGKCAHFVTCMFTHQHMLLQLYAQVFASLHPHIVSRSINKYFKINTESPSHLKWITLSADTGKSSGWKLVLSGQLRTTAYDNWTKSGLG